MNIIINKINFNIYATFILIAIITGMTFVYIMLRKYHISKEKIILSLILTFLFIIISSLFFSLITSPNSSLITPSLSSYGGALGLVISTIIYTYIYPDYKKEYLDIYIMSLPLMYSISKLGCFFTGCCHGIIYDGIFKVTYTFKDNLNFFPIQLVESFIFMIIFFFIMIIYTKKKKTSIIGLVFLISGLSKTLLDYLRYDNGGILSLNKIIGIICTILGIILILKKRKKVKNELSKL